MIGRTLGSYRIEERLGAGGMGVVYRARDLELGRSVAIKVLREGAVARPQDRERLRREARAASALNHPNLVTIYEIGRDGDTDFIAMEDVGGVDLGAAVPGTGLEVDRALDYALQIARGMSAAHASGIVHRDLKPGNVLLTGDGVVKIVDFGLARVFSGPSSSPSTPTLSMAEEGDSGFAGTPGYAAPEQIEGRPADARSDVFAIGAILYEMLSGRDAFGGESGPARLAAVLHERPKPLRSLRPHVPPDAARIVDRCLAKNERERYASARELVADLEAVARRRRERRVGLGALLRRPAVALPLGLLAAIGLSAVAALLLQRARERRVRNETLPEVRRLLDEGEFDRAFRLLRSASAVLEDDAAVVALEKETYRVRGVDSEPQGAIASFKAYAATDAPWIVCGTTPIDRCTIPLGVNRWRLEKPGYLPLEAAVSTSLAEEGERYRFRLTRAGDGPPGMLLVPGTETEFLDRVFELDDFWIDRLEVSNRDYQAFVDGGAYGRPEIWIHPLLDGDRRLDWNEAVRRFRDATGRPGPADWEEGSYPPGRADHPVTGISWYEAAAYCEAAGKSLPSAVHWAVASGGGTLAQADIAMQGNFSPAGTAPVGSRDNPTRYGASDMAGNAREWCLNATEQDLKWVRGGAWDEPLYQFWQPDALPALHRDTKTGFRCARFGGARAELIGPLVVARRSLRDTRPVSEEVFEAYRDLYRYDRVPVDARVTGVEEGDGWSAETIELAAAYGGEQLILHLLVPARAAPPYQVVVYFPGASGFVTPWQAPFTVQYPTLLLRGGRAVLYPIYKGMHERRGVGVRSGTDYRNLVIAWYQDLARGLDYLETRPDVDPERLAYFGFSIGGTLGPIFTALDDRFRASVLLSGGFDDGQPLPEIDAVHFAPRVRVPTLSIYSRWDPHRPLETFGRPQFEALGTPANQKRLAIADAGHIVPRAFVARETLAWLDRYLGPVRRRAP